MADDWIAVSQELWWIQETGDLFRESRSKCRHIQAFREPSVMGGHKWSRQIMVLSFITSAV